MNFNFRKQILSLLLVAFSFNVYSTELQIRTISAAPYGIYENEEFSGIYYEISNKIAKKSGYDFNNFVYPYARIMKELKSGKADVSILFKYKELEEHVIYVEPLPAIKNVVLGLNKQNFKKISDLKGLKIAYLRGAKFNEEIDNDTSIVKFKTPDFNQGVKMLKAGRVEAVIGPMDALLTAIYNNGLSMNDLNEPLVVSERTPWVQISKKSEAKIDVDNFKQHIELILKGNDLDMLRDKYIPKN